MKTRMKKLVALLMATTMTTGMLTGCSMFTPTAESLLAQCSKNMQKANTMDMDVTMGFGINMSQGEEEMDISFDAKIDMLYEKVEKEDYKTKAELDIELSITGGESQNAENEIYVVSEGDTVTTYTKASDSDEWTKKEEKKEDKEEEGLFLTGFSFDKISEKMVLVEDTVMEDGVECYVLEGDIESAEFGDMIEGFGMDEDMAYHTVMKIDKKKKELKSLTMTVDEEVFKKALEEGGMANLEGVSLEIDELEIEIAINEINGDDKVEIPDEVYEASEEESDGDVNEDTQLEDKDTDVKDDEDEDADVKEDEDEDADVKEDEDEDADAKEDEDEDAKDEEDTDAEDDSNEAGVSTGNKADFEAEGFACEEYVSEENDEVYLVITNNNNSTKAVEINTTFLKDGEVVDDAYSYFFIEGDTYQVLDLYSSEVFDSVEYSFAQEDMEDIELINKEFDITYDINEEGLITGTLTNNSDETASFAQIYFVYKNSDNEIISLDSTYADAETIQAGESSDFELYVDDVDYDSIDVYAMAETDN